METKTTLEQKLTARAAGRNPHFLFLKLSSHFDITSHIFHEKEEHVLFVGKNHAQAIPVSGAVVTTCPCCEGTNTPFSFIELQAY